MISKQYISRLCLLYILITIISWVIYGMSNYYKKLVKNDDCNYDVSDLGDGSLVFHSFSIIMLTFITLNLIIACTSFEEITERNFNEILCKTKSATFVSYKLYFACGTISFYEWIKEIEYGECKTEISRNYSTFGKIFYLWSFFASTSIISYILLKNFMILLYNLLKDANLLTIFSEIRTKIKKSEINKEIQTDMMILIPLLEKKESISLKCMICLENPIEVLFDCSHSCLCNSCYKQLEKKECPYCRKEIMSIKTIFLCGEKIEERINLPNTPIRSNDLVIDNVDVIECNRNIEREIT